MRTERDFASNTVPPLRALVVYESYFGNTEHVANVVAGGLRLEEVATSVVDVARADDADLAGVDLLVVGAPTHAFSLSRPTTREDAMSRGGTRRTRGIREWLNSLPEQSGTPLAAAFDTRVSKVRRLPMSASRAASRLLRDRGFRIVGSPTGFVVRDIEGPLETRQTEHAIAWARTIAHEAQNLLVAAAG